VNHPSSLLTAAPTPPIAWSNKWPSLLTNRARFVDDEPNYQRQSPSEESKRTHGTVMVLLVGL
ncbi:hypothetical protein BaRGS_00019650, partial [Batillaria attramentaria]